MPSYQIYKSIGPPKYSTMQYFGIVDNILKMALHSLHGKFGHTYIPYIDKTLLK